MKTSIKVRRNVKINLSLMYRRSARWISGPEDSTSLHRYLPPHSSAAPSYLWGPDCLLTVSEPLLSLHLLELNLREHWNVDHYNNYIEENFQDIKSRRAPLITFWHVGIYEKNKCLACQSNIISVRGEKKNCGFHKFSKVFDKGNKISLLKYLKLSCCESLL